MAPLATGSMAIDGSYVGVPRRFAENWPGPVIKGSFTSDAVRTLRCGRRGAANRRVVNLAF